MTYLYKISENFFILQTFVRFLHTFSLFWQFN